jgi:hypothetical protein
MNELLKNQEMQQLLVSLVAVLLVFFVRWLKSRVSRNDIVNEFWTYLQEPLRKAIGEARAKAGAGGLTRAEIARLAVQTLTQAADDFTLFEEKAPSQSVLSAFENEILQRLEKEA